MQHNARFIRGSLYALFTALGSLTVQGQSLLLNSQPGVNIGGVPATGFGTSIDGGGRNIGGSSRLDYVVGSPQHGGNGLVSVIELTTTGVPFTSALGPRFIGGIPGAELGFSVHTFDDVNGDGRPEVLAGSPGSSGAGFSGTVTCISFNATGTPAILWTRSGSMIAGATAGNDRFGHSVWSMSDITGDGIREVVAGAPLWSSSIGYVAVLNGVTGVPVTIFYGSTPGERFGWSVRGRSGFDSNGNGVPEVLVGAPNPTGFGQAYWFDVTTIGMFQLGSVAGLSSGGLFGYSVDIFRSTSASPTDHLAVSEPGTASGGRVAFIDPATLTTTQSAPAFLVANDFYGYSIRTVPDLDGDSWEEVLVGAPGMGGLTGAKVPVSGQTKSLLLSFANIGPTGSGYGAAVADGNGYGPISTNLVGAPLFTSAGGSGLVELR